MPPMDYGGISIIHSALIHTLQGYGMFRMSGKYQT